MTAFWSTATAIALLLSISGDEGANYRRYTHDAFLSISPSFPPRVDSFITPPERWHRSSNSATLLQRTHATPLRVCAADQADPGCQFHDLQKAIAVAVPGDIVELAAGIYQQGAVINIDRLTLRGQPGAHLKGHPVQGKAALVINGDAVVVEGIECSGIAVADHNGACIRIQGDDLIVRNVHFHDNEQGILGGGSAGGSVLIERSRFERNGMGGRAHGVYIGSSVDSFVFRDNVVLSTKGEGHGVKSRAGGTLVENNVIAGLEGDDSRAIDVPNGGNVVIRFNVLEKGPNSSNRQMIGLGREGNLHPFSRAWIEGNLFVFDFRGDRSRGVVIASTLPSSAVQIRGNVIVGARTLGIVHVDNREIELEPVDDSNQFFPNRRSAGLPKYPEVPKLLLHKP